LKTTESGLGCKKIYFEFDEGQVKLKETDCRQHGMNCFLIEFIINGEETSV